EPATRVTRRSATGGRGAGPRSPRPGARRAAAPRTLPPPARTGAPAPAPAPTARRPSLRRWPTRPRRACRAERRHTTARAEREGRAGGRGVSRAVAGAERRRPRRLRPGHVRPARHREAARDGRALALHHAPLPLGPARAEPPESRARDHRRLLRAQSGDAALRGRPSHLSRPDARSVPVPRGG